MILTIEEVRKAIYQDEDYPDDDCISYAEVASSFLKQKTGYDWNQDDVKEPLAKQCAKLYIRQLHFGSDGYNKEHDYTLGIVSLIKDLEDIKDAKIQTKS